MSKLAIVTASLDTHRADACIASWMENARTQIDIYIVQQDQRNVAWERSGSIQRLHTREILGVVPAFALGVQKALEDGAEVIACLHDDLLIEQDGWDQDVINLFRACPRAGLCGFGGAKGLGSDDLYKAPYNPMQLARQGFRSNMRHAEAHGIRSESAEPVACLDGFSQIGLAKFWRGIPLRGMGPRADLHVSLFHQMQSWGIIHHAYDAALGAFAKRLGYQVWYLPIRCHHFGGRTAVADTRYIEWANAHPHVPPDVSGDQMFWTQAHQIVYDQFQSVLPIRT